MKIKFFSTLILFSLISNIFAWENGNAFQLKSMAKMTPAFKDILGQKDIDAIVKYARLLDSATEFSTYKFLNKKAIKTLEKNYIYNTSSLKLPKALPLMFTFLVEAFKKEDKESIIFWSSAISHAINNIFSPYEEQAIDFLKTHTYNSHLTTTDGVKLDFNKTSGVTISGMLKEAFLKQKRSEFESSYKPNTYPRNFKNFYKTLFLLPLTKQNMRQDLCNGLAQTMQTISFSEDKEEIAKEKLKGLSIIYNLSTLGLSNTVDIIQTAKEYAEFKTDIKLPENNEEIIKAIRDSVAARPITGKKGELLFRNFINAPDEEHEVAIVVEPTYIGNKAILGHNSKIIAASIAGYLHKTKADYTLIDLRQIVGLDTENTVTLDPKKIPTLIIPITEYMQINEFEFTQRDFAKPFVQYIKKGGKVIWIGSNVPKFFGRFATKQTKISEKQANFENKTLSTSSFGVKINTEKEIEFYPLVTTPFLKEGLSTISKIVPNSTKAVDLIDLLHEEDELKEIVGFGIKDRKEKFLQFGIMPTYLFIPNILSKTTDQIWPLCLDRKSGYILSELLERFK